MRLLFSALTVLCLLSATAMACPGQTGKVIFEDTFTDDSGGWQLGAPDTEVKDGALWLRPNPRGLTEKGRNIASSVRTFSATDGDYCMEFVVPKPVAPDNDMLVGLLFWQASASDEYMWAQYTDGTTLLNKLAANKWTKIFQDSRVATGRRQRGEADDVCRQQTSQGHPGADADRRPGVWRSCRGREIERRQSGGSD
jgi:hypothetical protein